MNNNNVPFLQVLSHLRDMDRPFPLKLLHHFSDLSDEDFTQFKVTWRELPEKRKTTLLEDLEDLAESDTLTDFTRIALLAVQDGSEQVRELGIRLLWECEDKAIIPVLLDLIRLDAHERVRATAASAIGHFVYLGELEEIPGSLKDEIEQTLISSYQSDGNKLVRRRALESLGYSSREDISGMIGQVAASGDHEWIASSLFAMGHSADDLTWEPLVTSHITNPHELIRLEAVKAAGELELQSLREPLLDLLEQEENDEIFAAAIWSLSQIGGDGVRSALRTHLKEAQDEELQEFIEDALENLDFTEELSHFDLLDLDGPTDT